MISDEAVDEAADISPEQEEKETAIEQDQAMAEEESPVVEETQAVAKAILNGDIEILHDQRLPHLDQKEVKAYAATSVGGAAQNNYFALLCEKHLIPRYRDVSAFSTIANGSLVKFVASGLVKWPLDNAQHYVLVYGNNLGQPIMSSGHEAGLGWKHDLVMNAVIKPLIDLLQDFRNIDMVHGSIRPMNMFLGRANNIERVILGECLSVPPSYAQPAIFEPVERAMADPIARGKGTSEDDLYAMGVSLTMILRSADPLKGMSDEDVIRHKIEYGSYVALTGKDRFTGAILELLRGLLYDDPMQRWSLDEVVAWLDGQRLSPKQSAKMKKASRPFNFNNEKYFRSPLLAMTFVENQSEAVQVIDNGALEQWVDRSLEDNLTKGRLEQALETAREDGRGPGYWDRLLCRVSIALDPDAPIRFKGMAMVAEGIPTALAEAVALKKNPQPYIDIINQKLVMFWLTLQHDLKLDIGSLVSRFDSCRAFLRQTTMGYGIERCVYFLAPDCPCLSDRLANYYVRTPEDLMVVFEDMSQAPDRPDLFIDRHIAAFLSVKDRQVVDVYFTELNAPEYHRRILGNIKVLATIQKRGKLDSFPGVSRWVNDIIGPVYERYHDRQLRETLRKKMEKLKDGGSLTKIAVIFDNTEIIHQDFLLFREAMYEYNRLREEYTKLELRMEKPETVGKETGKEVAAIVSGVLAAIVILGLAFVFLLGEGQF